MNPLPAYSLPGAPIHRAATHLPPAPAGPPRRRWPLYCGLAALLGAMAAVCLAAGGIAYYLRGSSRLLHAAAPSDVPELSAFGELARTLGAPVSVAVGPEADRIDLGQDASIEIPAGAFPAPNRLEVTRVEVAFDRVAPDAGPGTFYVISTREDVPALGAPLILAWPMPAREFTVVRYEAGTWMRLEVEPGANVRLPIDHFSKGIFGFFEWWSERDVELGETIDSMDGNSEAAIQRRGIENGSDTTRAFFGVDEQSDRTDREMCAELISILRPYNTARSRTFPSTEGSTKGLAEFLFAGSAPSVEGGPFWELTEGSMEAIEEKLLASETPIGPAEFLKIAIDANGGNVPLGVLAAHNYLKEITYLGRHAYKPATGVPRQYGEPASHLLSWRQGTNVTPAGEYDKMGPIYHVFAAMTGALWLPTDASGPAIAAGEAFLRTFRIGGDRPDTPKASADQCGIDVAAWLRDHPPEEEGEETTTPTEPPATEPPALGQTITVSGTVTPIDADPGIRVTESTLTLTFRDDGQGEVTGSGRFADIYRDQGCQKDLSGYLRWELTGSFDPIKGTFSGTMQEFMQGQIAYTDCSVGLVKEFQTGQGGTWEAVFKDGVVRGSITLIQDDGTPLPRVTFEAR